MYCAPCRSSVYVFSGYSKAELGDEDMVVFIRRLLRCALHTFFRDLQKRGETRFSVENKASTEHFTKPLVSFDRTLHKTSRPLMLLNSLISLLYLISVVLVEATTRYSMNRASWWVVPYRSADVTFARALCLVFVQQFLEHCESSFLCPVSLTPEWTVHPMCSIYWSVCIIYNVSSVMTDFSHEATTKRDGKYILRVTPSRLRWLIKF